MSLIHNTVPFVTKSYIPNVQNWDTNKVIEATQLACTSTLLHLWVEIISRQVLVWRNGIYKVLLSCFSWIVFILFIADRDSISDEIHILLQFVKTLPHLQIHQKKKILILSDLQYFVIYVSAPSNVINQSKEFRNSLIIKKNFCNRKSGNNFMRIGCANMNEKASFKQIRLDKLINALLFWLFL